MGLSLLRPATSKKTPTYQGARCARELSCSYRREPKKTTARRGANGGERQRPPKVSKAGKGLQGRQRSLALPMAAFAAQCQPLLPNGRLCLIPTNAPRRACYTLPSPPSKYLRLFYKRNPKPFHRYALSGMK